MSKMDAIQTVRCSLHPLGITSKSKKKSKVKQTANEAVMHLLNKNKNFVNEKYYLGPRGASSIHSLTNPQPHSHSHLAFWS